MRWVILLCFLALGSSNLTAAEAADEEASPIRIFTTGERYEDVVENIRMAIVERGLLVSGSLHISDMLNRTGPDLGFKQVFSKAESVEFCSALMSHKMAQAAPENVVTCPFTISVYIKTEEPDQVYVAYRRPHLNGDSDEAYQAIVDLMEGVIQDSI
ncbi:MAG: hypothetical protein ABW095_02435 [Candidatus Thiodiazotropha sp.]